MTNDPNDFTGQPLGAVLNAADAADRQALRELRAEVEALRAERDRFSELRSAHVRTIAEQSETITELRANLASLEALYADVWDQVVAAGNLLDAPYADAEGHEYGPVEYADAMRLACSRLRMAARALLEEVDAADWYEGNGYPPDVSKASAALRSLLGDTGGERDE